MSSKDLEYPHVPGLAGNPMSKKPCLLLVVNDAGFFLSHRLPVAEAAREQGYDVHVATPSSEAVAVIKAHGFDHHAITLSRRGLHPLEEFATFTGLARLFRELRPDIVHNVTIKPVLYGGIAARLVKVPAVVSAISGLGYVFIRRGAKAALVRGGVQQAYRWALAHPNSKSIFQNPDDMNTLMKVCRISERQATLIRGSGVDLQQYAYQPEPGSDEPVVLLASRMLWDKGVGLFVEAAKRLRDSGVAARFVLVGESDPGNPNAVPTEQLQRWQREGGIEWWGRREDMPRVLADCAIFCLPSSYGEGVPKVLIEAAACGRPIVTTDWPGCREVVRHEENGLLVPVGDVSALARALSRLLVDRVKRARMGRRGREIAESEFAVEKVVSQTLAIYEELLNR